jgi:uncharacterized protein (DUF952 family)
MQNDLIFHIVEKNTWKGVEKSGEYTPESIEQEGFIHCSTGQKINDTANRIFKNKRHLFLLIIDTKRVEAPIKYEEDSAQNESYPHIYGPLNTNAVLDKISLNPDKKGDFHLEFSSEG